MTNRNSPMGGRLVGSFNSAKFDLKTNNYVTAVGDTTPLFVGDFVKTNNTSTADGIPIVTKAAAGDSVRGVVIGIEPLHTDENDVYRKASTVRNILVADDPYLMVEIQVNGILATTDIGKYANFVVNGGSTITGLSATQVDLTSTSTDSRQLRIVSIVERVDNEVGQYAKVLCAIHDHELAHGVTGSQENIWKRTGTLIEQFNAGDDVDLGTGDLTANKLNSDTDVALGLGVDDTKLNISFNGLTNDGNIEYDPATDIFTMTCSLRLNATQEVDNISTDVTMGGLAPSNTTLPTQTAIKSYVDGISFSTLWTTVGNVGSGAKYNSIADAITAGFYNLAIIGDFNETKDVTVGANSVHIKTTNTCNMGTFGFVFNSTGDLIFESGKLTCAYTAPGKLITGSGTGTLHMSDMQVDTSASSATTSIAGGNVNDRMQISNCRCTLADCAEAGFIDLYNSSMVTGCTFIGGGTTCEDSIKNIVGGTVSDLSFEGVFGASNNIIIAATTPSIINNIYYSATNQAKISLEVDANQVSNINGDLILDITDTSKNQVSNCYIAYIDLSDSGAGRNKFTNIHNITSNMTIAGNFNQFCNFESDADITIDGDATWISHGRAVNVTANGDANQNIICSFTSFTDNGSSNDYITEVVGTVDSSSTDLTLATAKGIYDAILAAGKVAVPAAKDSTGVTGQWAYGSNYTYRCVATDTWIRWVTASNW